MLLVVQLPLVLLAVILMVAGHPVICVAGIYGMGKTCPQKLAQLPGPGNPRQGYSTSPPSCLWLDVVVINKLLCEM
mgnify:CR=1 FL=1